MTIVAVPRVIFLHFLLLVLLHVLSASQNETSIRNQVRTFTVVNDTLPDKHKEQIQSKQAVLLVPLLCLLAFLIGLPANLLALWVLLFRTKKLPSTILLINLTSCDLLLLLVLPFRIVYHFQGNNWTFGEPYCRIVIGLFYGNMYGSVVCLAMIAVDRYVAIVHPFGAKTLRSKKNSVLMSVLVWIVVAAAALPLLVSKQSYEIKNLPIITCHDALPPEEQQKYFQPYFVTLFSVCFLLSLLVVLFCYGAVLCILVAKGLRYANTVRVTVLMLVIFVVCFLPSNVILLLHYSELNFENSQLYLPYLIALSLSTFNSCIDPFILYYVSEDFRKRVLNALSCSASDSESSSETSRSKIALLLKLSRAEGTLNGGKA
ncbi:proteinase-activated receptor 4-like [Myxocyprinus asiaticus]|uniref:proteinase-activated receptor 4-like n=1 Tax=Myxocyprinus asiaticus TaxID=70543 RepID=UPI00222344D4|nr:proteinase-activated receptor 4-like [Myxocyprinus asiaticus]